LSRARIRGSLSAGQEQDVSAAAFATIGDNCIDRFLPPVGDCLVGGNAVNVAVQLAKLGRRVDYLGAAGDDAAGRAVRDALAVNGVGIAGLRLVAGEQTARTDIMTLPDGDRQFVFESFGVCAGYRPSAADLVRIRASRHVHIGWMCGTAELRQALRLAGHLVSQDLSVNNAPAELDPRDLDIAFSSAAPEQGEAESLRLLAAGARLAVVTLGPAGALANGSENLLRVESFPTAVVDATGAGDAFIAGFLDAYAKGLKIKDCLLAGAERGALACRHRGGFPQVPLQPFVHDRGVPSESLLDPD
jgi:fructoselysine 6-kinase